VLVGALFVALLSPAAAQDVSGGEQHAADDDIVEMRHQEKTVVQLEIGRRNREQNAGHAANDEGDDESHRPEHRCRIADTAAIHGEHPIVDLDAGPDRDDARGDAEHGIDVAACPHREKVVRPDHERHQANEQRRGDHRSIAEHRLAGESRNDFGKMPKAGKTRM
jgi:hypothetical protein